MKKSTHKRLTAWLLTLALVVTLLPSMGMTALAVEDGGEGNGPPAVEVVAPEDESSGSDKTVGTPPSTEPKSTGEDKTTEGEGDPSGSDYNVKDDTQPRGLMRMPVMPTAAGDYPEVMDVSVDGGKNFATPGYYYFRNGESECSNNSADYNAYYNRSTGVLTLRNYSGGSIEIASTGKNITIVLEGKNSVNNGSINGKRGCNITITSSKGGTLSITSRTTRTAAIGIATGYTGGTNTGDVIITGNAEVTIDSANSGTSGAVAAYGIYAKKNITISGNASVDITCATPSNTASYNCYGIFASSKLTVNTKGEIVVDVINAGNSNTCSIGIQSNSAPELTKVGSMIVEWTKDESDPTNSGAAIYKSHSFSAETHAVNIDKANCYASYRYGTPRTVTVENGTLTGPGVEYPNGSGKFLADDKVKITPNEKTGRSGEVIPFQKWTSDDVTFDKLATTASNSFPVPNKDVTVTAMHSPFVGTPTFTPTSNLNNEGVLTFQTKVKPVANEYFKLLKVGEEGSYISIAPATTSTSPPYMYSCEATLNPGGMHVPPGDYYVAEYLDGTYYLSEKFTVNYVKPRPEISVSYWPDTTVFNSEEEGYSSATGRLLTIDNKGAADTGPLTITVEGTNPDAFTVIPDSIANIAAGGNAESTVRPAKGLTAGTYTATLKISGDNVNTLRRNVEFTVTPKINRIPRPTANTSLVYNGKEQTGVNESAGYTLTGTYKATDVGATSYTATAKLNSNYKWSDGGTEDVTITWNIGKRNPQPTDIVVTPPTKLVYDGNKKEATAELDSKYTGAGAITISKYVNDAGSAADPINAGTYTVYVTVAGGSNFNSVTDMNDALSPNWKFTIDKAGQNAPVGLTAAAPTDSGGKGKINSTTANMQYTKTPEVTTSWSDCTEGSTMVNPGTYYVRYKGDNNHNASNKVKVTVPEHGAGVTVSGTIKSYGSASEAVTVTLLQGTSVIGSPQVLTGASGSAPYSQNYSFPAVPAGEYTLKVEKKGHAPWTEIITVDSAAIAKDVTVYLWGDVNRDGEVTAADAQEIQRKAAKLSSAYDTEPNKSYWILRADVNRDGDVTAADAQEIQRNAAKLSSAIDSLP